MMDDKKNKIIDRGSGIKDGEREREKEDMSKGGNDKCCQESFESRSN